jgi:predicted DNA-binding transcriptional regulator AlpA
MDDQILTMAEAAEILKMTERQVYELTRRRSQERMEMPFPAFAIHSKALRVRKSDLTAWIDKMATQGRFAPDSNQNRGTRACQ